MSRILFSLLALLWAPVALPASGFLPLLTNFEARDYDADAQTWSCTQDEDGLIYFGNNGGMLIFDGYSWTHAAIPGVRLVRSVMAVGKRVYAGAFEEFGYFEPDSFGSMQYVSLSKNLKDFKFHDEEIWSIKQCGDKIYFQSFAVLFEYDGKTTRAYRDRSASPMFIFSDSKNLYSQLIDKGLAKFENGHWREFLPRERIGSSVVEIIFQPPSGAPASRGEWLLISEFDGIMRFDPKTSSLTPFATEADSYLKRYKVNRAAMGANGNIVVGTIQNGIFALSPSGKLNWHYNTDNGLNNNSVLCLKRDSYDNIWATLDDGISLIHTSRDLQMMMPDVHDPYIGMVYNLARYGNDLLIATNQGLYRYSLLSHNISEVPGMSGQNWSINSYGANCFISNNEKTLILSPEGQRIEPGTSTDFAYGWVHGRELLIYSSYYALGIYRRDSNDRWVKLNEIQGFGGPINHIAIDHDGSVWCSHMTRGIYHISLSTDLKRAASVEYFPNLSGDDNPQRCIVSKLRGRIVFADTESIYEYSERDKRFTTLLNFADDLPAVKGINAITPIDDSHFWVSALTSYHLVEYRDGHYINELTVPLSLFPRKSNGANNMVFVDDDGVSYFTINNGIGRFLPTCADYGDAQENLLPPLRLAAASSRNPEGRLVRLPIAANANPNTESENIALRFILPNFNQIPLHFRFTLRHGNKQTVTLSDVPEISYTSLHFGDYHLLAEAIDERGVTLSSVEYSFCVPKPWFLTWLAILLYVLAVGGAVYFATRWFGQRQLRRQKAIFEAERAQQERMLHEQEMELARQRRDMLESELSSKSKELASLAMSAYFKQQVLDSLRDSIVDLKRKGDSGANVAASLMTRIQSADTGVGEFWSVFEKNFDLIHEHFFRNLQTSFPSLSPTDLRFCALLRMNMSTKDIAKYTNITIRGVETARYRLRKKLNLAEGQSLVQFLIGFGSDANVAKNEESPALNTE